jgi:chromosome segregation ATPase
MSTAGKVLSVLVLLLLLVWMVLAAGVSRLNTNGNKALHDLTEEFEKLRADVDQTQDDVVGLKAQTASVQEKIDNELTVLRARQTELEKARSQIIESFSRVTYEVATVDETVKAAQETVEHRNTELEAERKALSETRDEVKTLMADSSQLMSRLDSLRKEFQKSYRFNVEQVGKH